MRRCFQVCRRTGFDTILSQASLDTPGFREMISWHEAADSRLPLWGNLQIHARRSRPPAVAAHHSSNHVYKVVGVWYSGNLRILTRYMNEVYHNTKRWYKSLLSSFWCLDNVTFLLKMKKPEPTASLSFINRSSLHCQNTVG